EPAFWTVMLIPSSSSTLRRSGSERNFSFSEPERILTVMRPAAFREAASVSLFSRTEKLTARPTPISRRAASAGPTALRRFTLLTWYRKPMRPEEYVHAGRLHERYTAAYEIVARWQAHCSRQSPSRAGFFRGREIRRGPRNIVAGQHRTV